MRSNPWNPIPDRSIEIAGRPMLPERLTEINGRWYVHCYLHGLIPADHKCGDSPGDHFCGVAAHPNQVEGDDHEDQACSHDEWASIQSDKLQAIAYLHRKEVDAAGGTSGCCVECDHQWPCPTAHIAAGWGEIHDCWDESWCSHAGAPLASP